MADNKITTGNTSIQQAITQSNAPSQSSASKNSAASLTGGETVTQKEFLSLLVNQLQNQDPMDPMNSDEFAVQLAQFSQVEQLLSINQKLDKLGGTDSSSITSMASFLGHQVVLGDGTAAIKGGKGPNILTTLPEGVQSARIDFLNEAGAVAHTMEITDAKAGKRVVELNNLTAQDGDYSIRVIAVNQSGAFQTIDSKVTGTVEGFVLEPEPKLIIDGAEVSMADIKEVYTG